MADGLTFDQAAAFAGVTVKIPPGVVSAGEGSRGRRPATGPASPRIAGRAVRTSFGSRGATTRRKRRSSRSLDDTVVGRDGNDRMYGNVGSDMLFGNRSNDTINSAGDRVRDVVNCGLGKADTAYFFPYIFCCSSSLLSVSALRGLYSRGTSS
jgi:hypothetical protein